MQFNADKPVRKDPYCSNCGYSLRGLTESSKCPECGKPLVEVLMRDNLFAAKGYRYSSKVRVFGMPLVSIAFGPSETERRGHARGIVAIGEMATGWLAIGAVARGIVAIGSLALGVLSFGGLSAGVLALGGTAVGGAATGGFAIGGFAVGGITCGVVANGGLTVALYAKGPTGFAKHRVSGAVRDPDAVLVFKRFEWLLGSATAPFSFFIVYWILVGGLGVFVIGALVLLIGLITSRRRDESGT